MKESFGIELDLAFNTSKAHTSHGPSTPSRSDNNRRASLSHLLDSNGPSTFDSSYRFVGLKLCSIVLLSLITEATVASFVFLPVFTILYLIFSGLLQQWLEQFTHLCQAVFGKVGAEAEVKGADKITWLQDDEFVEDLATSEYSVDTASDLSTDRSATESQSSSNSSNYNSDNAEFDALSHWKSSGSDKIPADDNISIAQEASQAEDDEEDQRYSVSDLMSRVDDHYTYDKYGVDVIMEEFVLHYWQIQGFDSLLDVIEYQHYKSGRHRQECPKEFRHLCGPTTESNFRVPDRGQIESNEYRGYLDVEEEAMINEGCADGDYELENPEVCGLLQTLKANPAYRKNSGQHPILRWLSGIDDAYVMCRDPTVFLSCDCGKDAAQALSGYKNEVEYGYQNFKKIDDDWVQPLVGNEEIVMELKSQHEYESKENLRHNGPIQRRPPRCKEVHCLCELHRLGSNNVWVLLDAAFGDLNDQLSGEASLPVPGMTYLANYPPGFCIPRSMKFIDYELLPARCTHGLEILAGIQCCCIHGYPSGDCLKCTLVSTKTRLVQQCRHSKPATSCLVCYGNRMKTPTTLTHQVRPDYIPGLGDPTLLATAQHGLVPSHMLGVKASTQRTQAYDIPSHPPGLAASPSRRAYNLKVLGLKVPYQAFPTQPAVPLRHVNHLPPGLSIAQGYYAGAVPQSVPQQIGNPYWV